MRSPSRMVVAQSLAGVTEEAQILTRSQEIRSQTNHTIPLLDIFDVVLSGHITGTDIVTLWQTPLKMYFLRNQTSHA